MSLQVFLQAQLLGSDDFLAGKHAEGKEAASDLMGRCAWLTLLGEVLPRALLSELKLSRLLLGSSSAEQFLLVLAEDDTGRASEFLARASAALWELSGNMLRLVWATTENLGNWQIVRKRLDDALAAKICCPLPDRTETGSFFAPYVDTGVTHSADSYFSEFGKGLLTAESVGWSAESPARLTWNSGSYTWPLREQSSIGEEGILFPKRFATDDEGGHLATPSELGTRADGASRWGVLRGDVDHFDVHLRRANSVEEHIHFSALFKEFFAGELALLCTLPDFWRKVSVIYRGGDDFAVVGSWDALILLSRELHRLFEKFVEHNLANLPGVEAKSISMALAIAPETDTPLYEVFSEAGTQLSSAKSTDLGSVHLFGRTLEWKRVSDADELKTSLVRLVKDFRYSPAYLNDLAAVYRESFSARAGRRGKATRIEKPWRTYMKLSRVIPQARGKEQTGLRNTIITNLIGKRTAGLKLRPSARVGLEWARLATGA